MANMKLSDELVWRGFNNQTTFSDITELDKKKYKLYFGVDPSADSMTVGNLASAMMVRVFIAHGHEATLLIGGATGLIGDPTDKAKERDLQDPQVVASNVKKIVKQYHNLYGQKIRVVNNYDWFQNIKYIDFLREVGVHFSLTPLLQRDYVTSRIGSDGSGMSYAEFSYSLIQGYDFYHLNKVYDIDLQVCGSDQWGNSISGVDLIRRKAGKTAHIYSAPLIINKTSGVKFGKSESGAIWLDEQKTSVFKFYQFWLNTDDESVADYLKIFTDISIDKFTEVMKDFESNKSSRSAQKMLAIEVTNIVHGKDRTKTVQKVCDTLFGDSDFLSLGKKEIEILKEEINFCKINNVESLPAVINHCGLSVSNSEAARFIESGSISVNGKKIFPTDENPFAKGYNLIKRGKNNFAIMEYK